MNRRRRVLSLQPYFGGSHRRFHNGWVENSTHDWTSLTLPARHWKWRMRHAAIYFSEQLRDLVAAGQRWDVIVCTDMLNVAELKGLVGPVLAALPIVVYFHENQFAYPNQFGFERDEHFPFTNFISAMAADRIWFNSQFNSASFIKGLMEQANRWPDCVPYTSIASLKSKMEVQNPGIERPSIDIERYRQHRIGRAARSEPMHIVWAARWEHDKNAEGFLAALEIMARNSVPFKLSVLGQSYRRVPSVFEEIRTSFSDRIVRWGYQESRQQYWDALGEADVFVSTANHEFFGLSAAESIAAGLFPLLPDRLAYPELLGLVVGPLDLENHLYDGTATGLADSLIRLHSRRADTSSKFRLETANNLTELLGWNRRAVELDDALRLVSATKFPIELSARKNRTTKETRTNRQETQQNDSP